MVGFLLGPLHNLFQLTFLASTRLFLPISRGWKGLQFPKVMRTLFRAIPRTYQKKKKKSGLVFLLVLNNEETQRFQSA